MVGKKTTQLLSCVLLALALSGAGCQSSTSLESPAGRSISGIVRYSDGSPVVRAKVWTDAGATTFSDEVGRYEIAAPLTGDRVTLSGKDGYTPGRVYGEIHFGSAQVPLGRDGAKWDLVLDQSTPI